MKEKFEINFSLEEEDWEDVNELLNLIIESASKDRASDIHFNPSKHGVKVRYRVDGVLREITTLPTQLYNPLIRKIKERGSMDTEINNKPQDGKLPHEFGEKFLDIRISTLPSFFGENIVMRILDKSTITLDLDKMGFIPETLSKYKNLLKSPYGMIVISGPTGCGKTTTGYASLKEVARPGVNSITVEDPVEYIIDNVIQTRINIKEGVTFPGTLRQILRQDPDIIYCSEIRDEETVKLLHQMALTGHLVITFLHTEDAPGAITRLIDLGIESFLISSAMLGVLCQRLIRTICKECKESYSPSNQEIALLEQENLLPGEEKIVLYKGKGCEKCFNTGYRGRTALHELLIVDEGLKEILLSGTSSAETDKLLRNKIKRDKTITLKQDGCKKALKGITTINEVLRVCVDSKGKSTL